MFRKFFRKILYISYQPLVALYLKKERKYYRDSMRLMVLPGIFHPGFHSSSKVLLDAIKPIHLANKNVLELGAGTGMLAVYCAKQKAMVTASDINWKAVINIDKNARWNRVVLTIVQSDLFSNIPKQKFDYIFINPPYYKKDPKNDAEQSWCCGKKMDFFSGLFDQLPEFTNKKTSILMALPEVCDINGIKNLAKEKKVELKLLVESILFFEKIYVFEICRIQ